MPGRQNKVDLCKTRSDAIAFAERFCRSIRKDLADCIAKRRETYKKHAAALANRGLLSAEDAELIMLREIGDEYILRDSANAFNLMMKEALEARDADAVRQWGKLAKETVEAIPKVMNERIKAMMNMREYAMRVEGVTDEEQDVLKKETGWETVDEEAGSILAENEAEEEEENETDEIVLEEQDEGAPE